MNKSDINTNPTGEQSEQPRGNGQAQPSHAAKGSENEPGAGSASNATPDTTQRPSNNTGGQ